MNKSRSSRRQRGIPISSDGDNDGILSCLARGFPDVLRCGPCKAKFDPIGFGRGNKNNIHSSSCCQLWIEKNCKTMEDQQAHALINNYTRQQHATASTTIQMPILPPLVFNSIAQAGARNAAGYTHPHLPTLSPRPPGFRVRNATQLPRPPSVSTQLPRPPSVSPIPFTQETPAHDTLPSILNTTNADPDRKACLGIAYGNSGSILSYIGSALRDSD